MKMKVQRKMASRTFSKVSMPAPKIPVYHSKKRITVLGLPLVDINRRGIPSSAHHLAVLIATFRLRLLTSLLAYHITRSECHYFGWARRFYLVSLRHILKAYRRLAAFIPVLTSQSMWSLSASLRRVNVGVVGPTYAALTRSFAPSAIMTFPLTNPHWVRRSP